MACFDRDKREDVFISKKQVADLVEKRAAGLDAEKVEVEMRDSQARVKMMEAQGMSMQKMG